MISDSVPEYSVWQGMIRRTTNPSDRSFHLYGGRGIVMCSRWRHDFGAFMADMGPRPSRKHTIERDDNDGDYEPGNCRWATRSEQMRNTRRTRWIEYDGRRQCLADWAQEVGISAALLRARLDTLGWSIEEALATPTRRGQPSRKISQGAATMDIGHRVRELRGARRQTEVADASGIGRTVWSAIERGHRVPTLPTLEALARGLGVTLAELVDPEHAARRVPQDERDQ